MLKWFLRRINKPKPTCEHDFIITERPVTLRRWESDWNYLSEAQALENGHWEYRKTTETDYFCKKCGFHKTITH